MPEETRRRRLDRIRAPRVSIEYDVETGDATKRRELPFVLGVLADLSGMPVERFPRFRERRWRELDLDNFDSVLALNEPRLALRVPNVLDEDGSELAVELRFSRLEDFEPAAVATQVEVLRSPEDSGDADGRRARQLDAILHAPEFQALEATWRGLHYLVSRTETSTLLKIRVLNVSKDELVENLLRTGGAGPSTLYRQVVEEPYGTFGGEPFAALIAGYEFDHGAEDVALLTELAAIGAAAHAPFVAAASARLFGLASFADLGGGLDLEQIVRGLGHARWNAFRDSEDARWTALTLPRVLLRLPYRVTGSPGTGHEERIESAADMLWGSAAWGFGVCLTNAFAKYGWCAAIRGVEGGGLVEGLPWQTVATDEGATASKCPTEVAITDRREKELADLGFLPLVHCTGTDHAAFFTTSSCLRPRRYESRHAIYNARLSTQLQCVLTISRFAHYLKAIVRDRIGSFRTRGEAERFLNRWIADYVSVDDDASLAARAKRPLRDARIDVSEIPGQPGRYRGTAYLQPHFQIDDLSVSLRLVLDLPAPFH